MTILTTCRFQLLTGSWQGFTAVVRSRVIDSQEPHRRHGLDQVMSRQFSSRSFAPVRNSQSDQQRGLSCLMTHATAKRGPRNNGHNSTDRHQLESPGRKEQRQSACAGALSTSASHQVPVCISCSGFPSPTPPIHQNSRIEVYPLYHQRSGF